MEKAWTSRIILRFARSILVEASILAGLTALGCYLLRIRSLEGYGILLGWVGMAVLLFAALTGIGGFASRVQDVSAFTLSGAGNMNDHMRHVVESRSSNLGCFIQLLCVGIMLIALGNLLQVMSASF
jgi:hypothetical protein